MISNLYGQQNKINWLQDALWERKLVCCLSINCFSQSVDG